LSTAALQAGHGEQRLLGRAVGFHAAVVFEVVARQVGEHRHVEMHAIHAPLVEADRGDFHRRRRGTLREEAGEVRHAG
jgi:hypothetical protein